MSNLRGYLQNNPKISKAFILGYIIFAGFFIFPFGNELYPFDFFKVYLVIVFYGIIALGLVGVYGINKAKSVYTASLIFTTVGLIIKYILAYGETSNTMNFTAFNIITYLLVIPVFTVVAYYFISKLLLKIGAKK